MVYNSIIEGLKGYIFLLLIFKSISSTPKNLIDESSLVGRIFSKIYCEFNLNLLKNGHKRRKISTKFKYSTQKWIFDNLEKTGFVCPAKQHRLSTRGTSSCLSYGDAWHKWQDECLRGVEYATTSCIWDWSISTQSLECLLLLLFHASADIKPSCLWNTCLHACSALGQE